MRQPDRSAFPVLAAALLFSAPSWAGIIETSSTVCSSGSTCVSSDTGFASLWVGSGYPQSYVVGNAVLYPHDPSGDQMRLQTEAIAALYDIAPGTYGGLVVDSSVSIHDTVWVTGWAGPDWGPVHPWLNIRLVGSRGLDLAPESPISDARFAKVQFGSDLLSGCINAQCNPLSTVTFDFTFPILFGTLYPLDIETHTILTANDAGLPTPYSVYTPATTNWTLESISVSYDEQRTQQMSGLTLHSRYAYPFASGTVETYTPEPGAWTLMLVALPAFSVLSRKRRCH